MRRDLMERTELKERREATDCANSEFNRVKRAKLENERAKSRLNGTAPYDEKAVKQLDRERANRASAAASRAKIVCYARELEKRTDRLERDRNAHALRAEKAIKRLKSLREESKRLKEVLRNLWQLKDPKTCSYLVDSNALFLLASNERDEADDIDEDLKMPTQEKKPPSTQPDYYPSVLPPPPSSTATTTTTSTGAAGANASGTVSGNTAVAVSRTETQTTTHTVVSPAQPRSYASPLPTMSLVHGGSNALVHHNTTPHIAARPPAPGAASAGPPPRPSPQSQPAPQAPPPHYHPAPPLPYPAYPPQRQPYVLAPPIPQSTPDIYAAPAPLVPARPMYYGPPPATVAPVIPPIRVPGETKRPAQEQRRPQLPPLP